MSVNQGQRSVGTMIICRMLYLLTDLPNNYYFIILYCSRYRERQIRFRCGIQNTVFDVLQARAGWQEVVKYVESF